MPTSFLANADASSEDHEFIIADICDDYFTRLERGGTPSIGEYIQRFPELSQEIREAVQALMLINASGDPSGSDIQAFQPPEIPGFVIRSEIGRGGVGVVYDAVQTSDSRRVAIKVLTAQGRLNPNLQERFLREADVSSRLNHPHIVRCIGSGRVSEDAFMTMEFIEGHNFHMILECLLKGKPSNQKNAALCNAAEQLSDYRKLAGFGADVASALSYAHAQRVIHRDIKPANLIVDLDGKAWVADFGLAKIFKDDDNLSRTGDMIGTPRYMAPEQVRGICSTHSDIYSLGVTLYEFAARKRAWESVAKKQLLTARVSMELPDLATVNPDVPAGLAKIITKACAFNPAERYESAEELETVLRRFAAGKANADRRTRERLEEDTFVRRRSILLTVGLIGGLTVAAVMVATGRNEQPPALDTPAKIISVLSNEKILNQAMDALPDSAEEDTFRKKFTRHATAMQAKGLVNETIEEYVDDKSDQQWVKETSDELVDAYKNGDISRKDAQTVITGAGAFISMMRMHSAAHRIRESQWPEDQKIFGVGVCNELNVAMWSGVIPKDTSSRLKQLIPGKNEVGPALDRGLQNFVRQAWATLNKIPKIPKGVPNAPERLKFFETARLRQLKSTSPVSQ